jgi:hypothetical protein
MDADDEFDRLENCGDTTGLKKDLSNTIIKIPNFSKCWRAKNKQKSS